MKYPPKLVGIAGRPFTAVIEDCSENPNTVSLAENPLLTLQSVQTEGNRLLLTFDCLATGRSTAVVTIGDETIEIPAVGFREKEYFMCLVISSNYHIGMDPEAYVIGVQPDGSVPEGHGFEKVCRELVEPYVRSHRHPVTWLIDEAVAIAGGERINRWHKEFADDYGIMPPSYIHYNAVNYNQSKTVPQITEALRAEKQAVESHFPYYTDIIGIDQFIGSIDDPFVKACEALGIHGLWGVGFDHFSCDTSMPHRGAPWDCYKPDDENMRRPAPYASSLWAFQWTQRDLLNTFKTPTGESSGSVIFSTDVDDIRTAHIMEHQEDYYNRMVEEYYHSVMDIPQNDFGVFLMHQEDHDTGFQDNNAYWGRFLDTLQTPVTFATLYEVAAWLNLKYPGRNHPAQIIRMADCLTCKEEMEFVHGIQKPADWGVYPPHVFYYDRDYQIIIRQGNPIPLRLIDYKSNLPLVNRNYPEEAVLATLHSQQIQGDYYIAQLTVDKEYVRLPLLIELATDDGPVFRLLPLEYVKKGTVTVKLYVGDLKHPALPL